MEQKGYIVVITSTTYEFCLQINVNNIFIIIYNLNIPLELKYRHRDMVLPV